MGARPLSLAALAAALRWRTVGGCSDDAGQAPAPAILPLRVPAVLGSSKRANRSRSLAFRVRSSAPVSSVRFVLRPRGGTWRQGDGVPAPVRIDYPGGWLPLPR